MLNEITQNEFSPLEVETKRLKEENEVLRQLVYEQDRLIRIASMPSHNLLHDRMLSHFRKARKSSFRMLMWRLIPPLRTAKKIIAKDL